jgi:large subunit ribosomal protein L1
MVTHGKRYQEAVKQYDKLEEYPLEEAIELVKKMATAKFDETIEMHFRLGIDPRHADQQVRSTVLLPHGLGRSVRILVFAEGDAAKAAEEAGADIIADDEVIARIQNEGWLEFDAAVAVPQMMGKVGRIARVLGPRGLMPNPKAGTVVQPDDMGRVIEELKAGRVEFRNDKTANLHLPIGKASFDLEKLQENAVAAFDAVKAQEPSSIKGMYIRKMVVTSTMGPAVRVSS